MKRRTITILLIIVLSFVIAALIPEGLRCQEKSKVPQDTTFAVKQQTLDLRIAGYERRIIDLQKEYEATQVVISELKQLRALCDTITVKKEKVK